MLPMNQKQLMLINWRKQLKDEFGTVSGIIGIGGGSHHGSCKSSFIDDE